MERRVLIEDTPRKRVLLADADMPSVAVPAQGELDLQMEAAADKLAAAFEVPKSMLLGRHDNHDDSQDVSRYYDLALEAVFAGGWRLGMAPSCSGWWDYAVDGTDETGRLWFERDAEASDGLWFHDRPNWATIPICRHRYVAGTMRWRGINKPWPAGYAYPVPAPARRARVVLL